ncbi:hypothetical protein LTR08_001860 [Meristemomyces frigidus]|nr:hypothetical protein LTR08_001860 [Meristemomyces frigidus]
MASRGRQPAPHPPPADDAFLPTRQIEAFSRTVQATASHLIYPAAAHDSPSSSTAAAADPYRSALTSLHRTVRRPMMQRSVFSFARANPVELIRSNFNTSEIEHRALTYLPDELLRNAPRGGSAFSLFDGFRASLPEDEGGSGSDRMSGKKGGKKHGRRGSRGQRLLLDGAEEEGGKDKGAPALVRLKRDKSRLDHRLEMMGIRKTMCASEIREIDGKIGNLNTMRKVVLERLAGLEQEEHEMEVAIGDLSERVEIMQEELEDEAALATKSPALGAVGEGGAGEAKSGEEVGGVDDGENDEGDMGASFMSESIYGKLPKANSTPTPPTSTSTSASSPRSKRKPHHRGAMPKRTISLPILHEHMSPGSSIRNFQAHADALTALDFDAPFGTLVTAGLDDAVRVWDLNAGRCVGLLEGHLASVRCLQVEAQLVATGSGDATVRLWDLGRAEWDASAPTTPVGSFITSKHDEDADDEAAADDLFSSSTPTPSSPASPSKAIQSPASNTSMQNCPLITLSAHVAEVTALNFRAGTLVSGSADKTLRQWDIEKGRCVQTLDVLWAAAQAHNTVVPIASTPSSSAFSSLTANTHTNNASSSSSGGGGGGGSSWWKPSPSSRVQAQADFVGALQVFDAALACGTADGVVRLWDLRSGMVHRSLVGHTGPVTALQFDDVYLVTGSGDRSVRIWDLRTGSIHDAFAYDHPITSMQFDARRIVAAASEDVVKVYDKTDGRHWDCGGAQVDELGAVREGSVVERVRIRDGYLVEGRRDGGVGVWSC